MQMTPISMLGNTNVFCRTFEGIRFYNWNGKRLQTIGGSNDATVSVSLFDVITMLLNHYLRMRIHLPVIFHRRQISG